MAQLRLVVADDNPQSLQALVSLLEVEFEIVATAADGKSALELIRRWKPDVVVVSRTLSEGGGIEVTRELAKHPGGPPVVVCSTETDPEVVEDALRAEAAAYVSKSGIGEGLVLAVQSAHQGKWLAPEKGGGGAPPNRDKFFKELGHRIRELRQKAGYTQAHMSSFGFSTRHWQQIEAGRPISVTTLLRICWVFKVNMDDLLRGLG